MIFIGLDLSLTNTGYVELLSPNGGILNCPSQAESWKPPKGLFGVERLNWYNNKIRDMCINHNRQGQLIAWVGIEDYAFARPFQMAPIGELGGVVRLHLFKAGLPYRLYTPQQVKKFCSGKGTSKKSTMILSVYKKWGFETTDDNIADALAIAKLTQAHYSVINNITPISAYLQYEQDTLNRIINPKPKVRKKKIPANGWK